MSARDLTLLERILALPTAPFVEHHVIEFIRRFAARRPDLECRSDRHGNLLVSYRRGRAPRRPPIALAAHLDHPGFVAERMIGPKRLRAVWRGGVKAEYFPKRRVCFFDNRQRVRGRIDAVHCAKAKPSRWGPRVECVEVTVPRLVSPNAPGMWDLPAPRRRGQRIEATACDDLAGAAAMLCALDRLCRSRATGQLTCLFTRAEEVGFIGAIAACRTRTLPRRTWIVAIECSSELAGVTLGDGPVLRVGDLARVFTPSLTAHCGVVADRLAERDPDFRYQRKLMDGGTCESAVYCEYGYAATGLCLALRNYHNMDRDRGQIAPESIHLDDFDRLVRWFVALAGSGDTTPAGVTPLRRRVDSNYKRLARLLV